jgi:hypothetical protein
MLGLSVLVGFVVLALLRLGSDRIPLEEWLLRRMRFHLQARRYTYQQPGYPHKRPERLGKWQRQQDARDPEKQPAFPTKPRISPPMGSRYPVTLAFDEIGIYPLVTALLAVLGIYFLVWLAQGGAAEISLLIGGLPR